MVKIYSTPYLVPTTADAMEAIANRVAKEVQEFVDANNVVPVGLYWVPGQDPHGGTPVPEQTLHVICVPPTQPDWSEPRIIMTVSGMMDEYIHCCDRCTYYAIATPPCDCGEPVSTAPGAWGWWTWSIGTDQRYGEAAGPVVYVHKKSED